MRPRIWCHLFAAAAGVIVAAGSVAAQAPVPVPAVLNHGEAVAIPAAGPTVPSVPVAGPTVVQGAGGCTNCGAAGTHPVIQRVGQSFVMANGGYFGTGCQYGATCNNGCGSFRADLGFAFGPCKSFFAPCGPGVANPLCGKCGPAPIFGRGPCAPFDTCLPAYSYGSH